MPNYVATLSIHESGGTISFDFDVSFQIYVEDTLVKFFNLSLISRAF